MYKCGFCGKTLECPDTDCVTFIGELNITSMCPSCFESTFNVPVISDWGEQLGTCSCCDRPIFQKDLDKGPRCMCGESYQLSLMKDPESVEEWKESFEKALAGCPRLGEVAPGLVKRLRDNISAAAVNDAMLTLEHESPFPEGEDPAGLDFVLSMLELYIMKNWG